MQLRDGIESLPLEIAASVVTIGFFDGVHLGHQEVMRRTVRAARERGVPSVAITFDRHPREILTPGREPRLLTTVERKAALIAQQGMDVLLVLAFTQEFSKWPAASFVDRVLVEGIRAVHVVVGGNFTFGHRAQGTFDTLVELGPERGFSAERVDLLELGSRPVSSSSVREALAEGDLSWPFQAMGRRFVLDGTVVSGAGRGETLGFPTANLETWPRLLLPGGGIYAGRATVGGAEHRAAIDVGTNPTFGSEPLHVESYLLDFEGDLVGREMSVEFWARLREEARFASAEELAVAIAQDVRRTRGLVPPVAG
jgi:riboflavin kinase/FMN adenylyltransferase